MGMSLVYRNLIIKCYLTKFDLGDGARISKVITTHDECLIHAIAVEVFQSVLDRPTAQPSTKPCHQRR